MEPKFAGPFCYPHSPTQAEWDGMTAWERDRYLASIPGDPPPVDVAPPEGLAHWSQARSAYDTLHHYFRRRRRKVFLACNLRVLYPGEREFVPDLMAVLDVDKSEQERERMNAWVVAHEGRGVDLALEIHVCGNKRKDLTTNVERYARLGVREYFFLDWSERRLNGWRLDPTNHAYRALVPQLGRFSSEVLDLDLGLISGRLQFFAGAGEMPDGDGLVNRLEALVGELEEKAEQTARALEAESERAEKEKQRAEEEKQRAEEAEKRLAEALAELERLKGPKP